MKRLTGHRVYLDTNVFVYVLNRSEPFARLAESVLAGALDRDFDALTGDLTLAEALVQPYRAGDPAVIEATRRLFREGGPVRVVAHPRAAFDLAAQVRATTGAGLIDALHVATASLVGCTRLVTNDARMPSLPGLEVVLLQDLEELPGA